MCLITLLTFLSHQGKTCVQTSSNLTDFHISHHLWDSLVDFHISHHLWDNIIPLTSPNWVQLTKYLTDALFLLLINELPKSPEPIKSKLSNQISQSAIRIDTSTTQLFKMAVSQIESAMFSNMAASHLMCKDGVFRNFV